MQNLQKQQQSSFIKKKKRQKTKPPDWQDLGFQYLDFFFFLLKFQKFLLWLWGISLFVEAINLKTKSKQNTDSKPWWRYDTIYS